MIKRIEIVKSNKIAAFCFMFGYLLFFYLTLWVSMKIFHSTIVNSWEILGSYKDKMKAILLIYPVFAVVLGMGSASSFLLSYTAMGSDRLTPIRSFSIGWFCIFIANLSCIWLALPLFINKDIGQKWLQVVGLLKFNIVFYLFAPAIGYIGAAIFSAIVGGLIEAQRE